MTQSEEVLKGEIVAWKRRVQEWEDLAAEWEAEKAVMGARIEELEHQNEVAEKHIEDEGKAHRQRLETETAQSKRWKDRLIEEQKTLKTVQKEMAEMKVELSELHTKIV